VTLSQIVHLTLRCRFEPDANFDKPRRLILRSDPPTRVCNAMTRTAPCSPTPAFLSARMIIAMCVA